MPKREGDTWSLTPDEADVFAKLRTIPAINGEGVATGRATGTFTRRGVPFDQVDLATCRRLAKVGLVHVDAGGYAHLTVEGGLAVEAST